MELLSDNIKVFDRIVRLIRLGTCVGKKFKGQFPMDEFSKSGIAARLDNKATFAKKLVKIYGMLKFKPSWNQDVRIHGTCYRYLE